MQRRSLPLETAPCLPPTQHSRLGSPSLAQPLGLPGSRASKGRRGTTGQQCHCHQILAHRGAGPSSRQERGCRATALGDHSCRQTLKEALQVQAGCPGREDLQGLLSQEKKIRFLKAKPSLKNIKMPVKMPTFKCSLNWEFSRSRCQIGAMSLAAPLSSWRVLFLQLGSFAWKYNVLVILRGIPRAKSIDNNQSKEGTDWKC